MDLRALLNYFRVCDRSSSIPTGYRLAKSPSESHDGSGLELRLIPRPTNDPHDPLVRHMLSSHADLLLIQARFGAINGNIWHILIWHFLSFCQTIPHSP